MTTPAALRAAVASICALILPCSISSLRADPAGEPTAPQALPASPAPAVSPETAAPSATPGAATATDAKPIDPIVDAIRIKLADKKFAAASDADDVSALAGFYAARSEALWIKDGAFPDRAKAVVEELKKANDWGLDATAFQLPDPSPSSSPDGLADADVKLSLAAMKYARYARGGRIDPVSLSNILDMKPPLKDPKEVITELASSAAPDEYLRSLHPRHPQFEALRQALLRARGPQQPVDAPVDEALKVKLPDGKTLKRGTEDDAVVLLRKRLKVETADNANARMFDEKVEAAVKAFQADHDLKENGQLNAKTRAALNSEGEPKKADPKRDVEQIIVNMERWRWLPTDLGSFYVMNNIPEFVSRVMKGNDEYFAEKIVVGQPTWPTPVLSASMQFVIFHPEWGVPDGIKVKELLPRLKRVSGDGGFFDQLFGGGSSGGARVLQAYKLTPTLNGHPVDANSVDWNRVDIRQFSFVQPAGAENPLGLVKFRFPNRHDVYMHDTPQKELFKQSFRALSHGCMRLDQPRKLAEIILGQDKGWSTEKVGEMFSSGGEVALSTPVPVYLTYFTLRVDADGKLNRYADIYGHDDRMIEALNGHFVRYVAPEGGDAATVNASADDTTLIKKGKPDKKTSAKQKRTPGSETAADYVNDALSGFLSN